MERRLELEGWIARTRRNQRTLGIAAAAGAAVGLVVTVWMPRIGGLGLGIVAIVAICGFWVTSSHIADWRDKLAQLDRPPRSVGRRS
jgi:hypothetical protein